MANKTILEELRVKILPILEVEDIELVELNFFRSKGRLILRLLVDKKRGRINLDECARLNERISLLLDSLDLIKERYILEVSSPGIDRPLKTKNDFLRVKERKITVFLCERENGRREFSGILKDVDEDFVYLEVDKEIINIPFGKIIKGKQVI